MYICNHPVYKPVTNCIQLKIFHDIAKGDADDLLIVEILILKVFEKLKPENVGCHGKKLHKLSRKTGMCNKIRC